jgi:mannose-1-phosphate guanylyltransferase
MANRWVVCVATAGKDGFWGGVPKALASLFDGESLLVRTLDRFAGFAPIERTVLVLPSAHVGRARATLGGRRPRILGETAQLALAAIVNADPAAEVVVTPADHHVAYPEPLGAAVDAALADLWRQPLALVGAVAHSAATDRRWLIPGLALPGGGYELGRVVERPNLRAAHALRAARALWCTGIVVARAADLCQLAESRPAAEPVRDVVARSRRAVVFPVDNSGWCDWATPERVFVGLGGSPAMAQLMGRPA